jgi:rubrerythrin
MQFESLNEIIAFAIEREKEAEAFYLELCQEEALSGNRELFQDFAREERKHVRLLTELQEKGVVRSLDSYKLKWVKDIKRSDLLVEMTYRKGMDYRDILTLAVKREEKALKLYNDLLRQTEDPECQKLFKVLCQEEAKHKLKFETLYDDFMAAMGD